MVDRGNPATCASWALAVEHAATAGRRRSGSSGPRNRGSACCDRRILEDFRELLPRNPLVACELVQELLHSVIEEDAVRSTGSLAGFGQGGDQRPGPFEVEVFGRGLHELLGIVGGRIAEVQAQIHVAPRLVRAR